MHELTRGAGVLGLASVLVSALSAGAIAAPRASSSSSATARAVKQAWSWYGRDMEKDIRGGHTPHWAVVNVNGRVTHDEQFDHGSGKAGILRVTGLGKAGRFKVVTLLPVSGHVGWANAQSYAKSNRYNLTLGDERGAVRWRAPRIAATGLVTSRVFDLRLRPGRNVLEFWADGSGGAGGYLEGRRYVIDWDGK